MPISQPIDSSILVAAGGTIIDQVAGTSDVAVSRWSIDRNRVRYQKDDSHTLSLYLRGGETSYRADQRGNRGAPGKLCMMPQGQQSDWHINGAVDFVHLYFSDGLIRHYASTHYDQDSRLVSLQDLTYADDANLRHLVLKYVRECGEDRNPIPLLAEETLYHILDHITRRYSTRDVANAPLSGGLAPHKRRTVRDAILGNLDGNLSITALATQVDLSPYHFARMFKLSFGASPAQYILRARIERAKKLLRDGTPIAQTATASGFSQQSHMTELFRRRVGVTPRVYQEARRTEKKPAQ